MIKKINRGEWEKQKGKVQKGHETWLVDLSLGDGRIRKKFPTWEQAKKFEDAKRAEHFLGTFVPHAKKDRTPFNTFCEDYYRTYALVNMVNADRNEKYRVEQFKAFFGSRPLCDIRSRDIEEWKAFIASHCQASTFNRALTSLKAIFKKAVEEGKLKESPAAKVKKLREENKRVRFLSEDEIARLFEAAPARLHDFITLALNTGMRKANLIGLCWEDIDTRAGVIHVLKTKSGKAYTVSMNRAVVDLLQRLSARGTTGRVLDTTNLRREWEEAVLGAGIKGVTIHTLRHTRASYLAMKGVDQFTLSQELGHSDLKMTQRYVHLAPNFRKMSADMVNFTHKRLALPVADTGIRELAFSEN